MVKLIQFLKGYVTIKVTGYSPERFMNLCCNHNILLWNVKNHGDYYTMCISITGYFRLKAIVKKTKTKVVIQQKCGLPFFVPKIRKRSIFGFGFLLCFLFLSMMSRYIWTIDLSGNETITKDVFQDFLEEHGVYNGMKKSDVKMEDLERSIRETFPNITWTSGRIDGTKLTIQIKENTYLLDNKADNIDASGYDLIALKDGIIVDMITRQGVPQVKIGDTVQKGQILVSGKIPILAEDQTVREFKLCKADADISLKSTGIIIEKLPLNYQQKKYTGNDYNIPFLQLMDHEIRLKPQKKDMIKQDNTVEKKQVQLLDNFYFPVYYGTILSREYVLVDKKYNPEQAKVILSKRFLENIKSLEEKGVQILEKDVKIEQDSKEYVLRASITMVESTGLLVQNAVKQPEGNEIHE